ESNRAERSSAPLLERALRTSGDVGPRGHRQKQTRARGGPSSASFWGAKGRVSRSVHRIAIGRGPGLHRRTQEHGQVRLLDRLLLEQEVAQSFQVRAVLSQDVLSFGEGGDQDAPGLFL